MMTPDLLTPRRDQLLIVNGPADLAKMVRARYPQFDVKEVGSYLEGISALAQEATRTLLVGVDPTARKMSQAVAGLRKAAGTDPRIILCCLPSGEPLTREVLAAGADDYLIYPPDGAELDTALAVVTTDTLSQHLVPSPPVPTFDELTGLTGVLTGLADGRRTMLERLCELIARTMRAPFVQISVGDESAHTGNPNTGAALVETISAGGRDMGRILIGPRSRSPFSTVEVGKLSHYGRLIAHLLDAADQQQQWHKLAMLDEVTQLPNRRYLMQALKSIIHRAARERFCLTVVMFDLDGFKHFNDDYGHATGDRVLQETARLLQRHCRRHDIVSRYAGDEFAVVFWDAEEPRLAGSKHPTNALAVLLRFRKALEAHEFPGLGPESKGKITISAGLATFPWDGKQADELIESADQAMLQAKRDGKNRIYLVGAEGEPPHEADGTAATSEHQ